jgi:hypothetical protein
VILVKVFGLRSREWDDDELERVMGIGEIWEYRWLLGIEGGFRGGFGCSGHLLSALCVFSIRIFHCQPLSSFCNAGHFIFRILRTSCWEIWFQGVHGSGLGWIGVFASFTRGSVLEFELVRAA